MAVGKTGMSIYRVLYDNRSVLHMQFSLDKLARDEECHSFWQIGMSVQILFFYSNFCSGSTWMVGDPKLDAHRSIIFVVDFVTIVSCWFRK